MVGFPRIYFTPFSDITSREIDSVLDHKLDGQLFSFFSYSKCVECSTIYLTMHIIYTRTQGTYF